MKRTVLFSSLALAGMVMASPSAWAGASPGFVPGLGNCTASTAPGDGANVDLAYNIGTTSNLIGSAAEDASEPQNIFSDVGEGVERADEFWTQENVDFYVDCGNGGGGV